MDIEEAKDILIELSTYDYVKLENGDTAIETVLSELEKKEAIINLMAKQLVEAHGWFYSEFDNFTEKDWIDYFTKKVEGK